MVVEAAEALASVHLVEEDQVAPVLQALHHKVSIMSKALVDEREPQLLHLFVLGLAMVVEHLVVQEDLVVAQEDMVVAQEDIVVAQEDLVVAQEDMVVAQEDMVVAQEDMVVA